MLVNKLTTPEVWILKLSNSDEVIAKIVDYDNDEYFVTNPYVLVAGQKGLQFSPMLLMGDIDSRVSINKSNVVARCKPSKSMLESYEQSTSAIALPIKQGIII